MAMTPEVSDLVNKIKTEQSASKMRGYIADGLQSTNEKAVSTDGRQDALSGEFDNLGTQFQNVIEETTEKDFTSAPEIIVARKDKPNLNARLDSFETETTAQFQQNVKFENQSKYVDLLKDMQYFNRMRFKKISENEYELVLDDGEKFIKYNYIKDSLDDFIKLNYGTSGEAGYGKIGTVSISTKTGVWSDGNANHYTSEIGASFTIKSRGSDFEFKHYADNRGGMWEFVIDGDVSNKKTVSTWLETVKDVNKQVIFTGLEVGVEHTIVGTFKGDDPAHAPSGGTSRGWAYSSPLASESTITGYGVTLINTGNLLAKTSNKEMAFRIVVGTESLWIPDHGTGTAFKITEPKFLLDNKEINLSETPLNTFFSCKYFSIQQEVVGRFPIAGDICNVRITESIAMNGVIDVMGSLESLQPFSINAGYPAMLPTGNDVQEFVTGIGSSKINDKGGTYDYFTEEKDEVHSVCAVSSTKKNLFATMQIEAPLRSMRMFEGGKPNPTESLFLWHRASPPKVYFQSFFNKEVLTGEVYAWRSKFLIGNVSSVYDFVKNQ